MLLNEFETRDLEERVRTELRFRPDSREREHSLLWWKRPFRLPKPWAVYALDEVSQEQIEQTKETVKGCLLAVTRPGEKLYALDWNHCAFLYDPRKDEEQRSEEQVDENGEKWIAAFPFYFPDGDYYFFLDEDFRFGYLGHPWRKEIWVFGEKLLPEIEKIAPSLGWQKLR